MEKSQVISAEVAQNEVEKWLDLRRVKPSLREKYKDAVQVMVESVCDGSLVLQDNGSLKQTLVFPIETKDGDIALTELVYKPRFKVKELSMQSQDMNASNSLDITISYVSAVSSVSKSLVKEMDMEDYKVAQCIVTFFM